ncbi:serine hydrolase domain-containing protein [Plantactinospora sp. KLBMP9567]|uniref:serine hydrolase domain-containing protein n=1 Tax=Plantactinospora sp. KLBMP9567 TaxID=3085900 RepID=UPI002981DCBF|nr:serine hydrolase domain-containing protein [Plantactinospora sp. KLBMP9567]MDW5322319.1 serine hydrolase domain-containing protein [Plantactinospora sp. KLBMP9567]
MNEIAYISKRAADLCEATQVPGFLAGIYHAGEQAVVAHGVANVATGAPMSENTSFLFGSITKIMTTTLVLQQVERDALDLDAPVVDYLPEFRLATPGAAEKIRVRHLVTHTSGIDADLFFPEAVGRDALKVYLERLGRECDVLFEPGEYVSYSNGGMIVAGRLLEVVTGRPYHELLERDVFAAAGMTGACTHAGAVGEVGRAYAIGHARPGYAEHVARRPRLAGALTRRHDGAEHVQGLAWRSGGAGRRAGARPGVRRLRQRFAGACPAGRAAALARRAVRHGADACLRTGDDRSPAVRGDVPWPAWQPAFPLRPGPGSPNWRGKPLESGAVIFTAT